MAVAVNRPQEGCVDGGGAASGAGTVSYRKKQDVGSQRKTGRKAHSVTIWG